MKLFFSLFCLITMAASAQTSTFHNVATLATPKGYSHYVITDLGKSRMLTLSGQVALDKDGNLVGKNDLKLQTRQIFENIQTILQDAGGSMNNLIKIGIFIKELSKLNEFRAIRDQYINLKQPPASTLVQVSGLFRDDLLVEVEATAIISK